MEDAVHVEPAGAGGVTGRDQVGQRGPDIAATGRLLAQKLAARPVPNTSLVEMQVSVQTKEEGRRYTEGFVETLQKRDLGGCGLLSGLRAGDNTGLARTDRCAWTIC